MYVRPRRVVKRIVGQVLDRCALTLVYEEVSKHKLVKPLHYYEVYYTLLTT